MDSLPTSVMRLAATDAGATLLTYALEVQPDPLTVDSTATLTVVASNGGRQLITCTSIVVTIPVGTSAKMLTATAVGTETRLPDHWNVDQSGGIFTFTPTGDAGIIGAGGLQFTLAGLRVNAEPGSASITLSETASGEGQPSAHRTATISVPKFPTSFTLSELTIVSPAGGVVTPPGPATLTWTSTGDGVLYSMTYLPTDGGVVVSDPVDASGPYTSQPLTRAGNVQFLLSAQVRVPGQTLPLVVQRQLVVTMRSYSLSLEVAPTTVGPGGLVRLRWDAPNAAGCTLDDGTALSATGTCYLVVRATRQLTMTAQVGGDDVPPQQQRVITVDPTIVATETGYAITGGPGANGPDGEDSNPDDPLANPPTGGGTGGPGVPAVVRGMAPPLDETARPVRVLPIDLVGGRGGRGGSGGASRGFMGLGEQMPGGPGGVGGDAIFEVTLDATAGAPAQYILVALAGGDGGPPGAPPPELGGQGPSGSVFMTIDGFPVLG